MRNGIVMLACVGVFAVAIPVSGSATAPPGGLFKHGFNKCKVASLAAVGKAAGVRLAKATFSGKQCTWSTADGSASIVFDTHPTGYIEYLVPKVGKSANGDVTRAIAVPGSTKALLQTHAYALIKRNAKDLFAQYRPGVVQVSMNFKAKLPDSRVVAVLRLLTHT